MAATTQIKFPPAPHEHDKVKGLNVNLEYKDATNTSYKDDLIGFFGNSNTVGGSFLTVYRDSTGTRHDIMNQYGSGLAFGIGDTQGFITPFYAWPRVVMGAGQSGHLTWTAHVMFIEKLFPVGALWISTNITNPGDLMEVGTWKLVGQNKILVACVGGDADKTVDLSTGSGSTTQGYKIYLWKRTQ